MKDRCRHYPRMSKSAPNTLTLVLGEKLIADLTAIADKKQRSVSFVARAYLEPVVARAMNKVAKS